jgi:N-acetylmuramoyl-L-alanine amidase
MVIKIPRNQIRKIDIINIQGGMTASQVYSKYKPDYLINLALYDMATGNNITHLKDENKESGYLFTENGIGIKGDNEIVFCNKNDKDIRDFVGGSPILLKNGEKCIDWGNKYSEYVDGSHIRSTIGFNDKEVILFASDKEMTLNELIENMELVRCQYAINLDGGGSSHLQMGSAVYRKSTRKNVSWLLLYTKEEKKMPKVCLDYGHGASTAGKRSPDGTLIEYEFNRDVGRKLKAILERHNVEVIESVSDDTDLALSSRCAVANFHECDYFVSIHANAHKEEWTDASGWEIYIIAKGGQAEELAKRIHKYSKELGLKDRGIKVANFQVLRDTEMPAVLIEHGFYTNKEECEKLKTDRFRQKCAECDAKGILEQLGIAYKDGKDTNVTTKNELVLTIDKKEYTINGQVKTADVAPFIVDGRTQVSIAVLRELGLEVEWNAEKRTVTVRG